MRLLAKLAILLLLSFGILAAGAFWVSRQMSQPGPLTVQTSVTIPSGTGTRAMGKLLESKSVISNRWLFEAAVRAYGLAPRLKAGHYVFAPNLPLNAVINKIASGDIVLSSITFPEGYTIRQSLKVLENNPDLTGPARPAPAEGYFFPDTYHFAPGAKRADIINEAKKRAETELATAWATRSLDCPYKTPDDLLTMASIIEKEAGNDAEMPLIAAVFVNRLKKNMKLQADPTVIYGADFKDNDLKTKDMKEEQPFNTYINYGLPPTAISNPGRPALMAAAQPAVSPALFFMAKPDRTGHIFSEKYTDHQKAVKAYWAAQQKVVSARSANQKAAKASHPASTVSTTESIKVTVNTSSTTP